MNELHLILTAYLYRTLNSLNYIPVPSAPADIKAVTSGETSVIVSWRGPTLSNGAIQKYTVYRREIISGQEV